MDKKEEEIVYEEVTVKVPKNIMNLLRDSEKILEMTPKEYIEYTIVADIRSGIDADTFFPSMLQLIDQYNLNPIFEKILHEPVKDC